MAKKTNADSSTAETSASTGRRQVNYLATRKREHRRKRDEIYDIIEACSPAPRLELFARGQRAGWETWGDQLAEYYPTWNTYRNHSQSQTVPRQLPFEGISEFKSA